MTDSPTSAAPIDALPFDPVSTNGRHDGWTAERQRRFIAALGVFGSITPACRAVGMSRKSAYNLRRRADAESFAEAWDIALEMGRDRVMERAVDRALNGYTRPVRYAGRIVAQRHTFDNRLAYALAYGERMPDPHRALNVSLSRITSSPSDKDT